MLGHEYHVADVGLGPDQQVVDTVVIDTHLLHEKRVGADIAGLGVLTLFVDVYDVCGLDFGFDLALLLGPSHTCFLIMIAHTMRRCRDLARVASLCIMAIIIYNPNLLAKKEQQK